MVSAQVAGPADPESPSGYPHLAVEEAIARIGRADAGQPRKRVTILGAMRVPHSHDPTRHDIAKAGFEERLIPSVNSVDHNFFDIHEVIYRSVDARRIMDRMVQPLEQERIFVCWEAYSTCQGWVEGALQTADLVLARLDGRAAPSAGPERLR